jgi:hypothetical protein
MALIAALIGGAATLGAAGMGMARSGGGGGAADTSAAQLQAARDQLVAQQVQQALANRRAVSGSTDSFGNQVSYDPYSNQWITQYGKLPQEAETASMQAGILKNTTDLMQQELATRDSIRRAQLAGPAADAAIREISNYSPMSREALTGLLTQQGVTAARESYDPLRADTLRSIARTGSAGGPVLAQLGKSEADNLRKTLMDAQLQGLSGADSINQQRQGQALSLAGGTSSLATPNLGQTSVQPSTIASTMGQLVAQRANMAGYGTPKGNTQPGQLDAAYANLLKNQSDPNFGLNQAQTGLKMLGSFFGQGGQGQDLIKGLFSSPTWDNATDKQFANEVSAYNTKYPQQTGDWWTQGMPDTYKTATGWD